MEDNTDVDDRDRPPLNSKDQKSKKRDRPHGQTRSLKANEADKDDSKVVKTKSKALRSYEKDDESSEEETVIKRSAPKIIMETNEMQLTEAEALQKKMDSDIEERNAFVSRMQEREDLKTKKIVEKGLTSEQISELATRGSISAGTAQVKLRY